MIYEFVIFCLFGNALAACPTSKNSHPETQVQTQIEFHAPPAPPLPKCCPNVTTLEDFNPTKFQGVWYEQRTYRPNKNMNERCATFEFKLDEEENLFLSYDGILRNGKQSSGNAMSRIDNPAEPAKLKLIDSSKPEADYWILGTDYDNWALSYRCKGVKTYCQIYATILTRALNPSNEHINAALAVARKNHLRKKSKFHKTNPLACKKEFNDLL